MFHFHLRVPPSNLLLRIATCTMIRSVPYILMLTHAYTLYTYCTHTHTLTQAIKKYRNRLTEYQKRYHSATTVILEPELLQQTMVFYCSLAEWLSMLVVGDHGYRLPLPKEIPPLFAAMPEFFVESIADFILFCSRYGIEGGGEGKI